jgi:hypothetical protein
MLDALCQCAGYGSGTTGEVDRSVLRLRLRRVDDQRDDVLSVQLWSGGEADRLPAELVSDRAFVDVGVFVAQVVPITKSKYNIVGVSDLPRLYNRARYRGN